MFTNKIDGPCCIIGDVHGELKYVETMINYLDKNGIIKDKWVLFLGDYIDNGFESAGVIDFLINFNKTHPKSTFICGNHDLNLTKALNLVESPHWSFYYNRIPKRNYEVLVSYKAKNGVELYNKMPDSHKDFLRNLPWCVEHPNYLFVHCGLDPTEPYESQIQQMNNRDFNIYKPKWLHDDKLAFCPPQGTDKTLVSGHTILRDVYVNKNRIILDTGCGYNGRLSAIIFPEMHLFHTNN